MIIEHSLLLDPKFAIEPVERIGVFPRGYVSIVAGAPGVGKTWFMLNVCKSVADGIVGLGEMIEPYKQGRALIFAGETGVRMLVERMRLLGGVANLENIRVISSHEMARLDIDVMINTAIGRQNIEMGISEYRPDIVFFDTMISFVSGGKDESSQADMTDPVRVLSMIASKYGCAIVLMHHFRKKGTASGEVSAGMRGLDEVIGSSALTRLASLVIGIERKREVRFCHCIKSWWEEFTPFGFTIKRNGENVELAVSYSYSIDGATSIATSCDKVLAWITKNLTDENFCIIDVMAGTGLTSRDTCTSAVRKGVTDGVICEVGKEGKTTYYRVVEKG